MRVKKTLKGHLFQPPSYQTSEERFPTRHSWSVAEPGLKCKSPDFLSIFVPHYLLDTSFPQVTT